MDSGDRHIIKLILGASIGVEWLDQLVTEGVNNVDDIMYLSDEDLKKTGMKTVDIRRLQVAVHTFMQWHLAQATFTPPSPVPPSCEDLSPGPPSGEDLAAIQDTLAEVERQAIASLDSDVIFSAAKSEVANCAVTARDQLVDPSRRTVLAINASNAIERALSYGPDRTSRKALEEAARCTRDVIVLRLQSQVPLGSRAMFISALEEAYGVDRGALPKDILAKLMHAHCKVVCPLFKHAFVSISCQENAARRHGPRGKRPRDVTRQAEARRIGPPPGLASTDIARSPPGLESMASGHSPPRKS